MRHLGAAPAVLAVVAAAALPGTAAAGTVSPGGWGRIFRRGHVTASGAAA